MADDVEHSLADSAFWSERLGNAAGVIHGLAFEPGKNADYARALAEDLRTLRGLIEASDPGSCTGATAAWCPVHGDCTCPRERHLDDPGCPLHGHASTHAPVFSDLIDRSSLGAPEVRRYRDDTPAGARDEILAGLDDGEDGERG